MTSLIVMQGLSETSPHALRAIAEEFGWSVETAADFDQVVALGEGRRIAAVLFHREAFGPQCSWSDALLQLGSALPETRLIPCHGFSEPVDWNQLSDAGAFHSLWLPLKENEIRQCLGFIWQAQKQSPVSKEPLAARFPARSLTSVQLLPADRPAQLPAHPLIKYSAA